MCVLLTAVTVQLVSLALWQIWNYSKDPDRGAGNVEIWIDELLVHCGDVRKAKASPPQPQTILFTNDKAVVAKERQNVRVSNGRWHKPEAQWMKRLNMCLCLNARCITRAHGNRTWCAMMPGASFNKPAARNQIRPRTASLSTCPLDQRRP